MLKQMEHQICQHPGPCSCLEIVGFEKVLEVLIFKAFEGKVEAQLGASGL